MRGPDRLFPGAMAIQEVISELNFLKDSGLIQRYAIGGAIAAFRYIEPSTTSDVDVFVVVQEPEGSSLAPLQRIWPALIARGAKQIGERLEIGDWPVQFLGPSQGVEADAVNTAREDRVGDLQAWFFDPEHVVAVALATRRSKDYQRVDEFVRTGKVDLNKLFELIERFQLQESWNEFKRRYP